MVFLCGLSTSLLNIMIHFVTGLPGDGKTLYSVHVAVKRLVFTNCTVVTNVSMLKDRLNEYIQDKYPHAEVDVMNRVRLIKDEQVSSFFRYRSGDLDLPIMDENGPDGKKLDRLTFLANAKTYFLPMNESEDYRQPVFYIIDEAHDYFNAREWMTTGRALLYYCSKHRHLGDEIIFITQHLEQCERQLRNLCSEYHRIKNHYRRSMGFISSRGRFTRESYYQPPTSPNVKSFEKSSFKIDAAGVASCYETRGALGIEGTSEQQRDVKKRRLPWWSVWLGLGIAAIAVFVALKLVPMMISSYIGGIGSSVNEALTPGQSSTQETSTQNLQIESHNSTFPQQAIHPYLDQEPRHYKSLQIFGHKVRVVLENGAFITHEDPWFDSVDKHRRVWIAGVPYLPPKEPEHVQESPALPAPLPARPVNPTVAAIP